MKQGWEIKKQGEVCTSDLGRTLNQSRDTGDITKEIVMNEYPFDERLSVFSTYMMPLAKYIDNIHNVIDPEYSCA